MTKKAIWIELPTATARLRFSLFLVATVMACGRDGEVEGEPSVFPSVDWSRQRRHSL